VLSLTTPAARNVRRYAPRFIKRERIGYLCITNVGMAVDIGESLSLGV
jgi:hypothetical protein